MTYIIKKGNKKDQAKGTWWKMNEKDVTIKCPECGGIGGLDHEIDKDGKVSPSLDCPRDKCSFHTYVKLEGWK